MNISNLNVIENTVSKIPAIFPLNIHSNCCSEENLYANLYDYYNFSRTQTRLDYVPDYYFLITDPSKTALIVLQKYNKVICWTQWNEMYHVRRNDDANFEVHLHNVHIWNSFSGLFRKR